jgi:hypothetical protein
MGSQRAPALVKVPENAFGVSGMTAGNYSTGFDPVHAEGNELDE